MSEDSRETENDSGQQTVLPKEISNLSFQELQELSNQCGSKMYGEFLNGKRSVKKKHQFPRENKNRPREMSSKIPPFKSLTKAIGRKLKLERPRDPRFHSSYGTFDQKIFEENYKFLNKIKKKEKKILLRKLGNPEIDEEERSQIRQLIQRLDNQKREEIRKKQETKLRTEEREYEIEQLNQGRKPEFCRKSDEKLLSLVRKFETMKEKGGLQKHIRRRRKKSIRQDKKKLSLINKI